MDETDLKLIKTLLTDSRTPYRELAGSLDLSVNAVHKRIQALMEEGVIKTFTTKVSLWHIAAATVLIFGSSKGKMDEVSARLGRDERIYWVSQGSGGITYVGAYLREIAELNDVVALVKREGMMDDPTVGIMAGMPFQSQPKDTALSKLDLRIIREMANDSRKPVSDIALELNTSAKTVRRRLDRMLDNKLIECSLEWYPDKANDIISMFHIKIGPQVDWASFALALMSNYAPASLFFMLFSNLPDTILLCTWSNNMKDVNELRRRLDSEAGVVSLVPVILYGGQVYETWRERLVGERLALDGRA